MQSQFSNTSIVKAIPEQVSTEVGGEVVILHLKSGKYFGLNALGTRIWSLIQQPTSIGHIQETLLAEYDVSRELVEKDVAHLLQHLADSELIEVANEPNS